MKSSVFLLISFLASRTTDRNVDVPREDDGGRGSISGREEEEAQ